MLRDPNIDFVKSTEENKPLIRKWLEEGLLTCDKVYRVDFIVATSNFKSNSQFARAASTIIEYESCKCEVLYCHPYYLLSCSRDRLGTHWGSAAFIFFDRAEAEDYLNQKIRELEVLEITEKLQ
jgi:hypothetical protein